MPIFSLHVPNCREIVSPYVTILQGISSEVPLLIKSANSLFAVFKNWVVSFSFIFWLKYIVSGSEPYSLAYISVILSIFVFMAMISPGKVVTEAYFCEYFGNQCPRLDMVLHLGWLAYVCLFINKLYTAGLCSVADFCIGDLLVSYS